MKSIPTLMIFTLSLVVAQNFAHSQSSQMSNIVAPNHYGLEQPLNPGEILLSPPWPPIPISDFGAATLSSSIAPIPSIMPIQNLPIPNLPAAAGNFAPTFESTISYPPSDFLAPAPYVPNTVPTIPGEMIQSTIQPSSILIPSGSTISPDLPEIVGQTDEVEVLEPAPTLEEPSALSIADQGLVSELQDSLDRRLNQRIDDLRKSYDIKIQQLIDQGKTTMHPKVVQLNLILSEKIESEKKRSLEKLNRSIKLLSK